MPRNESVVEGQTVTIQPYGATFELPGSWVGPTFGKNLFLSQDELRSIGQPKRGQFIWEESAVMNSVLPFDDIAVHAGEKGWDSGVISNQVRVYVVNATPQEIGKTIEQSGSRTAAAVFDKAIYTAGKSGEWNHSTINYLQTGGDTFMFRDIDFYYQTFGGKTVVFVFIHAVGGTEFIQPILNSFRWKTGAA